MGAAGFQRQYILYEADLWELHMLMRGYMRRARPIFEANRLTAFIVSRLLGGKLETPRDLVPFVYELADIERKKQREHEEFEELYKKLKQEQQEQKDSYSVLDC